MTNLTKLRGTPFLKVRCTAPLPPQHIVLIRYPEQLTVYPLHRSIAGLHEHLDRKAAHARDVTRWATTIDRGCRHARLLPVPVGTPPGRRATA